MSSDSGATHGLPRTAVRGSLTNGWLGGSFNFLRRHSMARVSTYLNFARSTEEAFLFTTPISRFREFPAQPGQPPLAESDRNLVMHVVLPILGGHVLMGTYASESMGFTVVPGNTMYINLEPGCLTVPAKPERGNRT